MPILDLKVSAAKTPALTRDIAALLLELTAGILGKRRDLTAIAIGYVDPDDWIVGGEPLSVRGRSSFYLEIKITDESNTWEEKARYIREVFAGFERLLGELHEESYIHVHDVRAAAYGYGGFTQERRRYG
ncbi:4-oxalocrotonate tautomerase family protein [Luteimonas sp. Y-2-2-4F]|nr:4-oxalocrotonate tautomerase family protein [Luteimonas sp. Y-2-2-4F]MCD9031133.1 4-oxalocrotonate tautomerase family protein [Luteimonas sp. Y-2-2-4F]